MNQNQEGRLYTRRFLRFHFLLKGISSWMFSVVLLCFFNTSFSQDTIQPKKLKVGLVLSGGGAKGFAHIGVLKVIEEAGVEISFIGGTSMGAVVGGLYASGYNARQIDSIFKETDFDALLSDFIPRSSKTFYEKRNDEMYAFTLPFNKFHIGIPTALSRGMYNYNLLNKLTDKVRHIRDFNKLPIPFLCIASDIETGEEVLLNKGYLPQAMLASGAFPTLFSPVEIDGRLLVDGGVTNNYPIEEVRKLGADVIIGVDVQDDLKDRTALKDATRILVQISNLQMMERMKRKIDDTDIYIKPDITDYSVISFDQGQEIIRKGEEAAFAVYEKIKVLGNNTYFKKNGPSKTDSLYITNIGISRLENYTRSYIIGKLRFKKDSKISYEDLRMGIDNLSSTQNFSFITYRLEKNSEGDDLVITLKENPVTTYLRFAVHYDDVYKTAVMVNLTQKKTLFKNDIASIDVILGDNIRYNLDYYVDNGFYWSFGFKSKYNRFTRNVATDFSNGEVINQLGVRTINIDYSDFTNQAYVQTIFVQKFLVGAGMELKHLKIKSKTTGNFLPNFDDSDYFSVFGSMKFDSFDNKYFPKRGGYFQAEFQSYLFSSDFTNQFVPFSIVKGDAGFVQRLFRKATAKIQAEAGFTIGSETVHFLDFSLGGYGYSPINNFKHFYGYDFMSLSADSFIKSTLTLDYEIFKKHHVNFAANYANIENKLFDDTDWTKVPKYSGYAVGYGLETIIGPIEFKYTWSPEMSRTYAWFSVGFWF